MRSKFLALWIVVGMIAACSSGKNALKKGNYDAAVLKSIKRLQHSPNQVDAQGVLTQAFDLAIQTHLSKISDAKLSSDSFKWEQILSHYKQINELVDELNSCPACLQLVTKPIKYVKEYEDAKYQAAEARYMLGEKLLRTGGRENAKLAYNHFIKAQQLYPALQGIQSKIADSYWQAVLKVGVQTAEVNSTRYKLSNAYFQEQIAKYLGSYKENRFVQFFTEQELDEKRIEPDQLIQLSFDDFVVGQVYVKERVEKLKRDSVVIGENRQGKIYGTVKAELSVFDKQIASTGVLNFSIYQASNYKVLNRKKMAGSFVWTDNWAVYRGDVRALTKQQLALCNKKEAMPPSPPSLFVEFTKPIFDQLVTQINSYYRNY
jgi:hypothetical protein